MLNKSMNLQKEVRVNEDKTIAFLNSQISIGYSNINISIQIIDKEYIESNPQILKDEYDLFMEEVKNEAINNGWKALKDTEILDTETIQ